jgi:3-oxoacyl-[acyl-carrier protein] reductase
VQRAQERGQEVRPEAQRAAGAEPALDQIQPPVAHVLAYLRARPRVEIGGQVHVVVGHGAQYTRRLLEQRVALVPGGARGIGRRIALALAERGWSVAIAYRTSAREAAEVEAQARAHGVRALAAAADVSQPEQAEALVRRVEGEWDRIDALVHCAGPYHRVDLLAETPEGWDDMFRHNLHSLFYCARAVAPGMIARRRGRILAFSMAGAERVQAQTHVTAHFIAKMGVQVLIRSLARTLAPHGVTANCLSPGFVDSGSAPPEELQKMLRTIPAGRLGTLDDVAAAALFLLSDEAAYVNGANLVLSGGWGV